MINIEERVEKAKRLFKEGGYNCCQAVVLAYNDVFGIDDTIHSVLEAISHQTVQDHFCNCLLTFKTLTLGFHPDNPGQKIFFLQGQFHTGISTFHFFLVIGINERFFRHGHGIIDPGAAVAIADVSFIKSIFKCIFQIPERIICLIGIIDHDPAVFIDSCPYDEMLTCCK